MWIYDTKHIQETTESGRNSAMLVVACIICNLLQKAQEIPEIQFLLIILQVF